MAHLDVLTGRKSIFDSRTSKTRERSPFDTVAISAYDASSTLELPQFGTGLAFARRPARRSFIGAPCLNMPLPVTTFCAYRTRRNGPWTDRDHAASKFIKALKEQPVSGWAYVPIGMEHVRLNAANAASAPDIFARQAAYGMKWDQVGALMLVPIPDSSCTVDATDPPKTIKMAVALLRCIESVDAIVADLLRWSEAMTPAHVGLGTRAPKDLLKRLRLRSPVPPSRRVVQIDDVTASGGHLRAAAAFSRIRRGHDRKGHLCRSSR
jgi:hypothetical protein